MQGKIVAMKFVLHTIILSPHQLPLARALVCKLGAANFRYIYTEPFHVERRNMGWRDEGADWTLDASAQPREAEHWLNTADIVLGGIRDLALFEERSRRGLKTFYMSERWFKPWYGWLPGWLRLVSPPYW